MNVQALVTVQAKDLDGLIGWDALVGGQTLLEVMVRTLEACPVIDAVVVASDLPDLARSTAVPVVALPENMARYEFNYLGTTLSRVAMETHMYRAIGLDGDIVFHADWRLPLLTSKTLERMYHLLLDSPALPARVVPITPEDPGLFMRHTAQQRFFPVWHAAGIDRQLTPRLYRPAPVCVSFMQRLGKGLPLVKGWLAPKVELVRVTTPEHLALAEFLRHGHEA
jgi:hypothetical protein